MTPIAILISGRGSNMEALLRACDAPGYPARCIAVASNRPDAGGLDIARARGLPAFSEDHRAHPDRESFERRLDARLREHGAELLVLAGFMRVLTPWFVDAWAGRMINIHPSLLPGLRGVHTHARALEAGARLHGCSVHHVTAGVDEGRIIGQAAIAIRTSDTPDTLAARVLRAEHLLYPRCLAAVCSGDESPAPPETVDVGEDRIFLSAPPAWSAAP